MKSLINRLRYLIINALSNWEREEINGKRIVLPYIAGIQVGPTEPWMVKVLQSLLSVNAGIFVDVGVNLGQTLIKLKALEKTREYIGFEPNPTCLFYSGQIIEKNHFTHCTLVPVALALKTGLGELYSIQDSSVDSAATIVEAFRPEYRVARKAYVPLIDLHSNLEIIGELEKKIGIIKIDVEGSEFDVMRGMEELIRRDFPTIIVEILPVYKQKTRKERKVRQESLESMMRNLGYSFYRILCKNEKKLKYMEIKEIGIHDEIGWADYVLIHYSKIQLHQDILNIEKGE